MIGIFETTTIVQPVRQGADAAQDKEKQHG